MLYTDGLVEHRTRSIQEGLDRLTALLDRVTAPAAPRPMEDFLARLRRANPDDDTCVLAARPRSG